MSLLRISLFSALVLCLVVPAFAQSPDGTMNGLVLDPAGRAIAGASVIAVNDATGVTYKSTTNKDGIYILPNLPPGPYRLQISQIGFKTIIKPDIILNVQDALSINFTLTIGALHEVITVEGGTALIDTEAAAVSTVVDRQFAENLPMNGRSFQSLIQLTPGVVSAPVNSFDGGQFSVNGQRTSSNYWTLDGVSANVGASATSYPGNGSAGALPSFSVLGGTNSLVSVDAMQEFRIQTSGYAPEYGRTPGAQIAITTRSGSNQFHGTLFDYLRNSVLDANDWFADHERLPKPGERQNDFGGTFGGPILKNETFFFFSYEGLRLRLPQTLLTTVPDLSARQNALPALKPFLNAFPLDPKQPDLGGGIAQFNASFSNPATLDAYSMRIDHQLKRVNLFARYNDSPSEFTQRGNSGLPLSVTNSSYARLQSATVGGAWSISPTVFNDLRFNYSRTQAHSDSHQDGFGGAVPVTVLPFPQGYSTRNSTFDFYVFSLTNGSLSAGKQAGNVQRQMNWVDGLSLQSGKHSLKFGIDYRRLVPQSEPLSYLQEVAFSDLADAENGNLFFSYLTSQLSSTLILQNLGVYAQDTWQPTPRLTLTYGIRWDVDFAPASASGPDLPAITRLNLRDFSSLALAPSGTAPFSTRYGNVAPRLGAAYRITQTPKYQSVLRAGVGVFYDLATSQIGNLISVNFPFGARRVGLGGTFPLSAQDAAPPTINSDELKTGTLYAVDPKLELPYTVEWNVAIEQALGRSQSFSASYVGSVGRRLIQTTALTSPNPSFANVYLVTNTAHSNYNALQLQFNRRLTDGLQALASYTWSHSIDDASAGSAGNLSNALVPGLNPSVNRGPSDFDIREAVSGGFTYEIPRPKTAYRVMNSALQGWSLESMIQARSAPPVDISYEVLFPQTILNGATTVIRPDVVPGQPFYLYGAQYPGGKAFNPAAFTPPPADSTGNPLRQGDLGRNALRGFGAVEWDFAVHREFPIHESVQLQFRAELFNLLNHPNFGTPNAAIDLPNFGLSTQTLAQSLSGGVVGGGGFNALYQIGGPRSVQLALKLIF